MAYLTEKEVFVRFQMKTGERNYLSDCTLQCIAADGWGALPEAAKKITKNDKK